MKYSGVEDLTIDVDASYTGMMIYYWYTYASWVKNVELAGGDGNQMIYLYDGLRNEVRDCYLHDTDSTTDGYGILTESGSAERGGVTGMLIENNIFSGFWHGIMLEATVGTVVSYNFFRDSRYLGWPTSQLNGINLNHGPHGMMILVEGNVSGGGVTTDGYHGSVSHVTLFRNWLSGKHVNPVRVNNVKPVDIMRFSYYSNVVGNVLGHPDWHDAANEVYQMDGSTSYNNQPTIYRLGYPNIGNWGFTNGAPPGT